MEKPASYGDILSVLTQNEVEFVIVGGAAAILGGAPFSTIDRLEKSLAWRFDE